MKLILLLDSYDLSDAEQIKAMGLGEQQCRYMTCHWLAALGYCWARLKVKMCKFEELQEPQKWKHGWEWHTSIMILTCFLLQEQQIKWAQKIHLLKCLIYTILLLGIFSTCILQESPQPSPPSTSSLGLLLGPGLRRETSVKRQVTAIKRSNWK